MAISATQNSKCIGLGIRFAYLVCMSLVAAGLAFSSQTLLLIANGIALLGVLPPRHPVDYFYNYIFRLFMGRPKIPPRANQGRFACYLATSMLLVMNYYFYTGNFIVVYIFGAMLLGSAFLVSFFDLCIPSKIYNAVFVKEKKQMQTAAPVNPE